MNEEQRSELKQKFALKHFVENINAREYVLGWFNGWYSDAELIDQFKYIQSKSWSMAKLDVESAEEEKRSQEGFEEHGGA